MKVLVTGGAGFIGSNLIEKLLEQDYEVISIDNYSTGSKNNHHNHKGVKYVESDIRNIDDYSLDGKPGVIFHLAAIARITPSFEHPEDYFTTNANATLKIAKYCSKNKIPLIYAGSSSHHSGKFKNPYTFSKDIGEEIVKLFQEHYGLKASIARFYNVYGPRHLKEGGYCTLIGVWENCIEKKLPITIYGDGSKRRDFTHVEDIIDGLLLINEKQAWGHIFELGRGKNHSVKEIADMFGTEVKYAPDKKGEAIDTLCTDDLAKKMLGWKPKKDIKDHIKKFVKKSSKR